MNKPGKGFIFCRTWSVQIGRRVEQFGGRSSAMFESLLVPIVSRLDDAIVARSVNERIHPRIGTGLERILQKRCSQWAIKNAEREREKTQINRKRLGSPEFGVERSAHDQEPRQDVDEDSTYPRWHGVRLWRAKVHVQHDDSHADAAMQCQKKTTRRAIINSLHLSPFVCCCRCCVTSQLALDEGQKAHLNVSRIMVKSTNLPKSGTTKLVGGIISASKRKNTVNDRRIDMAKLTCHHQARNRK